MTSATSFYTTSNSSSIFTKNSLKDGLWRSIQPLFEAPAPLRPSRRRRSNKTTKGVGPGASSTDIGVAREIRRKLGGLRRGPPTASSSKTGSKTRDEREKEAAKKEKEKAAAIKQTGQQASHSNSRSDGGRPAATTKQ